MSVEISSRNALRRGTRRKAGDARPQTYSGEEGEEMRVTAGGDQDESRMTTSGQ